MFNFFNFTKYKLRKEKKKLLQNLNKNKQENRIQISRGTKRSHLTHFYIKLAQHCNLGCKGCDEFSPLAQEEFIDIKILEKDLKRLEFLTKSKVDMIILSGGEPLLLPEEKIIHVIKLINKFFPKTRLSIYTNGILLKNISDELWNILSFYKVCVCVTLYPINVDYNKLAQKAKEKNVMYSIQDMGYKEKTSWYLPFDLSGQQNAAVNFLNCMHANNCIYLNNGKLYTCSLAGNVQHFNKYFNEKLPVTKNDYIDIYKAKNINEILEFLSTPIPFCQYCDVNKRKFDTPWSRSSKDISEWS